MPCLLCGLASPATCGLPRVLLRELLQAYGAHIIIYFSLNLVSSPCQIDGLAIPGLPITTARQFSYWHLGHQCV